MTATLTPECEDQYPAKPECATPPSGVPPTVPQTSTTAITRTSLPDTGAGNTVDFALLGITFLLAGLVALGIAWLHRRRNRR